MNRWVEALVPDLANEPDVEEYAGHLEYWAVMEALQPGTSEWAEEVIRANPGTWTAWMCRAANGVPETPQGIAYCGLCTEYANGRKRKRNERLALMRLLPGFEEIGGNKQPHPPCAHGFTRLRHTLYRLKDRERVLSRREQRPDPHNHRGWDLMTCYY
jgi:hypothetical protein